MYLKKDNNSENVESESNEIGSQEHPTNKYTADLSGYSLDKFPSRSLRPEVVGNHNKHIGILKKDIRRYSKVGYRDIRLFNWLLKIFENLGLSTIRSQYLDSLAITKTRLAMFTILIDDPIDDIKKRNFKLSKELLKIPFDTKEINISKLSPSDIEYLEFAKEIWSEIKAEAIKYPKYENYSEVFDFDIEQLINSMKYSRLVNAHPNVANLTEIDVYIPHSMLVLIESDLDLMCSEGFDEKEFGDLRELGYISQKMAKIGNIIGTYPREILENDMSSRALVQFSKEYGTDFMFKLDKFLNKERRRPELEKLLKEEWFYQYQHAQKVAKEIKSIDGELFLKQLKLVQDAHQTHTNHL